MPVCRIARFCSATHANWYSFMANYLPDFALLRMPIGIYTWPTICQILLCYACQFVFVMLNFTLNI